LIKTLATSYEFFLIAEMVEPMFGGNIYGIGFILGKNTKIKAEKC
jgi:hypothetical protein